MFSSDNFSEHDHCQQCAEACFACAKICREMAA
ncbi:four-helix bundle copper-binding protein [Paenibacillus sp. Marseille-Q9583]